MGSVVISGSTSGTVTVSAPAEAGTRTLTLPAATGTAILEDGSNNLQMNSGFGSSATAYGVRAWANWNGTSTVAIRASGNVSSITDTGTGDYKVNFATNMPDANYGVTYGTKSTGGGTGFFITCKNATQSTSAVDIITIDEGTTLRDSAQVSVTILR